MPEYPSNSHNSRGRKEKNLKPIVSGDEVETRKKPLTKKFAETMFNTDVKSVKTHLIQDILIPSIQDFIFNGLHDLIDTIFKDGDVSTRGYRSSGRASNVSYDKYFYKPANGSSTAKSEPYETISSPYDVYEHIFTDSGKADRVLEEMRSIISEFGVVTLNDYYELIGVTSKLGSGTDADFGWENLDRARVVSVRGGRRGEKRFTIELPRIKQIRG